nr:M16 family metallopeptidase [Bacteroides sp. 224]
MIALLSVLICFSCQPGGHSYESVPNDPLQARIYTLENGLKVYMTVNKETPRIQTYIAVRVGGKNDPAETTGLAHYFEHLMFKGTEQFGTQNYEAEKVLLDQIEAQFEIYRKTTDEAERKAIYHVIDSLSYEASKYSIPNEYDKLMSAIGAKGTNAYTAQDRTVYIEDIPSNQVENWAKIQADRLQNNVIRGFHTELETVYEEKNMSLTQDGRKVAETVLATLFPNHPYGKQTVLGSQEHLKNPSITKIKEYYRTWYVPNNMAICLSGDFDPDEMITTIEKYFGGMKPNPNLPEQPKVEKVERNAPTEKEVYGLEAESMTIGYPMPGIAHKDFNALNLLSRVLYNGKVGLMDVDLNQQQKTLGASGYLWGMTDHSIYLLQARPKNGQTLDEVKELLLSEIEKLKAGNFNEEVLQATINNYKLSQMHELESNNARADMFVHAFGNNLDWKDEVNAINELAKITKEDIIALANKYFANNYAVIYKKQGPDANVKKIDKPSITPIIMNRDAVSPFLKEVQNTVVPPIEPVFLDYDKDLSQLKAQADIPVLYKKNTTNDLFNLTYVFEMGNNNDKALSTAYGYLRYLGTSDMTLEEINSKFYSLACSYGVSPGAERMNISLSGLNENLPQALELLEKLLADAQVNEMAYNNLVVDQLKSRSNIKLDQSQNFSNLVNYATYGPNSPAKNILSEKELKEMNPQELVDRIKAQNSYKHRILYYGPNSEQEILDVLKKYHRVPETLKDVPAGKEFPRQETPSTKIYIAPYKANQIYMSQYSNRGEKYNPEIESTRTLYNDYFSGGMNSIVFQEMREARALAYSAWAGLNAPANLKYTYNIRTQIATQNDKMIDAIGAFNDIINNMPQSENAFSLAKDAIIGRLRTERITKNAVLWNYISAQDLGLTTDKRIKLFNEVQNMTIQDVVNFQEKWVKDRTYTYCILGDEKSLDMKSLEKLGPIERLSTEDLFGF